MDAQRNRLRRIFSAVIILSLALAVASADYVVAAGDTLGDIARDHGVSVADLAAANALAQPDLIHVGQVLVIPGAQGGAGGAVHVVEPGDTLTDLAARFGTSISALVETNQLADPDLLRPGQQLALPGAVPASPPVAPAPTPPSTGTHLVAAGETLAGIAKAYGLNVSDLAAANGITDPSLIHVGTTLRFSGPDVAEVVAAPAETVHVVAAGESLNSVASQYGVAVGDLVSHNGLSDPNLIRAGQELAVPGMGGSPPAWICPVAGASYINDWGFPRSGGRAHLGNDLFAAKGSAVVAPVGGSLQVMTGPVGGLQFRLYGEDGVTYIGSHLDSAVDSQYVAAGTLVGTVGDSGNAFGAKPHLHFEMSPGDGLPANPYPVLKAAGC